MRHSASHITLLLILVLILCSACSTKKNTATNRWWQSFTTRYNVYYNGHEAYKAGCATQETGNQDNFTEMLPLFTVGNEKSRSLGLSNFEVAITKCKKAIQLRSIKKKPARKSGQLSAKEKAFLSRTEYNPFLKNAWLLMGKSQFQKGDFIEAASTFAYISRIYKAEPEVVTESNLWLARCYAELDWFYDAEDALRRIPSDSIPHRLKREHAATMADMLLRQERFAEALPYLTLAARKEPRKMQKARLYFLLGQVQQLLGNKQESYKALQKCLKQSPPYQLAFNARILQTEVLADAKTAKKAISRLRRMARSENNKEYLDQVYYAMGNVHLLQNDTAAAIAAYEAGREKGTRNGIEKGVLLLRLGSLYWDLRRFDEAQKCYGTAIGLIEKTHDQYAEITRRSKVLDELVPHTSAIHLQDSLLHLAVCPEEERLAAIDRVIEALRKKEEEERKAREDSAAEARSRENGGGAANANRPGSNAEANAQQGDNKTWYFYNPMLVMQGKQDFQKTWGKRKLEDNWRRSNRSVIAQNEEFEEYDYAAEDSLSAQEESTDSLASDSTAVESDSTALDPHNREYYLAQIPFSDEAKEAAHAVIREALYNAGIIEKDKLEDFPLAAETFTRLYTDYPDFEPMDEVFHHLFLLYSRWGKKSEAEDFRTRLANEFPESELTRRITDPEFEYLARHGVHIEDSLYTAAYLAYRRRDNAEVERLCKISTDKFPSGLNRPKFLFVSALSRIGTADSKELAKELRDLVSKYPESDVSEMAGMIVKGLEAGRQIGTGTFDLGSLWSRRSSDVATTDSTSTTQKLSDERMVPFVFVIAYPTDSIDDKRLLYDVAHFNFTSFMVRGFDISIERTPGITQFRVSGFGNYDEVHAYAQRIYKDTTLAPMLRQARVLLISQHNLELLGTQYSFDDYKEFYDKTFAPLEIDPELPLDINEEPIEQRYEDEYTPEQLEGLDDDAGSTDDGGEWY